MRGTPPHLNQKPPALTRIKVDHLPRPRATTALPSQRVDFRQFLAHIPRSATVRFLGGADLAGMVAWAGDAKLL
jgi:hypothetical protein